MLAQPEDLLQTEERAVLEMLTSMSDRRPAFAEDSIPPSPATRPHSPTMRPRSLPGALPSNDSPPPHSNPPSLLAGHMEDDGNLAGDEAEVNSLLAPTALEGSTAVSYHSSGSSSHGNQSEESADPAFGHNLRALYHRHDPNQGEAAEDTAMLDSLGLPIAQRTVELSDGSDLSSVHHENEDFGFPPDFGYRAGFQTQPRMTFDVHTIEEVAEPSSSGTSATSRTELSAPPPRPPARLGQSPFQTVSVGSPLGSRFRTMLQQQQQQRDREQQGLSPNPNLLTAPGNMSPLRSPASNAQTFLTAQRSMSPLRSTASTTFETPPQTPNPTRVESPPPSSLSGSQPSSPSKVRQLSRFFDSSVSGGSDSDLSGSSTGRRAAAAAGVMGGAMAAVASRDRERMRDMERSLASSPTRRQPSGMTTSTSNPTLRSRPESPGSRSPIFTISRSLDTFGPQATANTPPTTMQRPMARRGMPARPSVRSIARQFATMLDDGSSSPRSGRSSPLKPMDEDEKDQRTVEAILGDSSRTVEEEDVPLNRGTNMLSRNTFGTVRSSTQLSNDAAERGGSEAGAPVVATESVPRPGIRTGDLWYFNPHRAEPIWIEAQATLMVDALELYWKSDSAAAEDLPGLRLDLTACEDAHSVFSPDHGSSYLDVGAQTARAQNLMRINPFQLQFPDGIERLATRTPMERLHWIEAICDVLRHNVPAASLPRGSLPGLQAFSPPRTSTAVETQEGIIMLNPAQNTIMSTPTRGSFVTAEALSTGNLTSPSSPVLRTGTRPAIGTVTRLISAFSETSSEQTPLTAVLGRTAEPHTGPPVPPKRDGEQSGSGSPGDPQYGEVNVTAPQQVSHTSQGVARSIGASLDDRSTQAPLPSTRYQSGVNFFNPTSTLSGTVTPSNEFDAFGMSGDIIDDFGPLTPPAMSQVSVNFSELKPFDSASNRVVPSEIGTIRREPVSTQPPPFFVVSPEMADPSTDSRPIDSMGRGPYSTPGQSRYLTPVGSLREANRASSHLPLSHSEPTLPIVPEEAPSGSRSASATPTQLTVDRKALAEHDLNRSTSAVSQRTVDTHKTRATATSVNPGEVAQLLDYLEEQARARSARDRYLEEQIKDFQQTIAGLQSKRAGPPSEPSDSSGGQTMHTAPDETPQPSEAGAPAAAETTTHDELTAMQKKLDKVLKIVSTVQGGAFADDVNKILGAATASSISAGTDTFQTASAGIPSPPQSLTDGDDSVAFRTAPMTQTTSVRAPPSEPSSWISGSTMMSNWTGRFDEFRRPPRSWTSSVLEPDAPPNSVYAPSSLGRSPSISDVTITQAPPSTVMSSVPSIPDVPSVAVAPSIPRAPSTVTLDMDAAVRHLRVKRAQQKAPAQQGPAPLYPENQMNGWYTPKAADGSVPEKELPIIPGIRWTPGGQPFRAPSIASSTTATGTVIAPPPTPQPERQPSPQRREVATYTQEDFMPMLMPVPTPTLRSMSTPEPYIEPEPEPGSDFLEPPPSMMIPPPTVEDYQESNGGSTVTSNASAEFKEVLRKLAEAEEARQQQQKQQADIARYLNELNAWLERDVMDRTKEWRALSSGVQQLSDDLGNIRTRPPMVQLSDPPRSDDGDGRSSRPARAESPTGPAALRPNTTLSLAPPIVAPAPYAGANWSNPEADRPESDSGTSRRSGRVWSAAEDDDEKDPKKKGLLSRVTSKVGKVAAGAAGVAAVGLIGNEIRKHVEKRDDKEKREERDKENQERKDLQEKEKREEKRDESIRKDEAKERKELMSALAKKDDKDTKEQKSDKKADAGVSEAAGAIAVTELAKIAANKTGGSTTTVVTPAGTITTGNGKGADGGSGGGGGGVQTTADSAPQNTKGTWQTNLPRAERVQQAFADSDSTPTPLKDAIKSALKSTPGATVVDAKEATDASKEAAKASKEAAVAAKEATTALNAAGGGTQKKKAIAEGDAGGGGGGGGGAAKTPAPAVTVTPQPDGSVNVQAIPAKAAKAAPAAAPAAAAPAAAPAVVVATPAHAAKAKSADGGKPAADGGKAAADAGGAAKGDKGGDKKDSKAIVKETAGGAALTVAVEEILKHLMKQQDDARKQQDDAKKAEASLKAAQVESEKKAKEAREKEKVELSNAVVSKLKEEQAKDAKAMDAKTAIEQLVANLNAQKATEAKRQADADATIKKLADELLKLNTEQSNKAVAAVQAASKDTIQKSVKDYNDELTKVLSKEVKAMFEDIGKIRETKRSLELEIGDLFAIKARHLKDVAPPKAAALPGEKKKGEEPKKDAPKKEEPKKEEPKQKVEAPKPPPLTVQLPDRSKYEPLMLNFGPRPTREAAGAAAPPKGDKPKEGKEDKPKEGKDGKDKAK
ncbi:unnamed protein product [Tilletia controversa]|nr:unnamed protein product [Tilletia controversa]CAD6947794.1 unnamed protein product [Tilletia controversa]